MFRRIIYGHLEPDAEAAEIIAQAMTTMSSVGAIDPLAVKHAVYLTDAILHLGATPWVIAIRSPPRRILTG